MLTGCTTPASKQSTDAAIPIAEEDGKSTTDPHVWHNAQNGIKIAETIATSLDKSSLLEIVDSHKSDDIIAISAQIILKNAAECGLKYSNRSIGFFFLINLLSPVQ